MLVNPKTEETFIKDIEFISRIPIVGNMLDVICSITGMGFTAIARVTEERWITCSVRDDIGFGLKPGDELQIKTTICNEIRQSGKPVIIDHVSEHPHFKTHHTPAMYGFESYISIPIFRKDGRFFGTLCAIDPHPHNVSDPMVTNVFYMFADLISFHLDAVEKLDKTQQALLKERTFNEMLELKIKERTVEIEDSYAQLEKMNKELQSFAYISSHDLQEPLRKIQTFASIIEQKEIDNLSETGKDYFKRMQQAAERMQILINDLLTYSRASVDEKQFEITDLRHIIEQVKEDLKEELLHKNASVVLGKSVEANVITFQFRQLLYNLVSNAIKFSIPGQSPKIFIEGIVGTGASFGNPKLLHEIDYCHIRISDNGVGFDQQYAEKIFELFQRLHDKTQYAGTGIGLAIVKKIVENHHGFVSASGKLNEGATFNVYLPVS